MSVHCKERAEAFHPQENGCRVCVINVTTRKDCKQRAGELRAKVTSFSSPTLLPAEEEPLWINLRF